MTPSADAPTIIPAEAADGDAVRRLLTAADLVTGDLDQVDWTGFLVLCAAGETIGAVGVEPRGTIGLLRSLVIAPEWQGYRLGTTLLARAETRARADGLTALWLLTTTAPDFFARRGYTAVDREQAPAGIKTTAEYRDLCPGAAVVMHKPL